MTNRKVTKWLSIKLLLVISLFFAATATEAQNKIQVTSFNRMETDVTARITAPQRDQNGEVCALIRIVTIEKDLMFEPDALGIVSRENKPGEIWLYIPRGARRISIMHDKFGVLRNYFYPDIIEKATVYEMEIQIGDGAQQTPANTNTQLIVMRPDPATADIYIDDDEKVPTENGLFTATMKKGTHTYRVESPMYAPEAGVIDLGSEQKIMSVTLKPRFGYLEIFSLPEQDAKVFINNELAGQTPYKSDRMPLQEYRIRIEKEFFFPMDSTVTIFAGKTSSLTFKMKSTIKPKEPRRTLVMAEVGYHPSQISFGAMVGIVSKNGAYLRFRSDFGSASTELECDDTGALANGTGTPYYKEGVTNKARMSITAGYLRQIIKPLYAYIGAGYGNRVLAWETIDGELVKNTDHSATGVAAELGAIGRLGQFAVSVGFQTVNFKYHELSAGIGFFF